MNISIILGVLCIGYGVYTAIARKKAPEKFGKLEAMKKKFGDKTGAIIHIVSYTIVPIIVGIVFLIAGYFGAGNKNSLNQTLVDFSNETNKSLPSILDSETRLDTIMALPNNGLNYVYTMINMSKDGLDLEGLEDVLKPQIINNLRTDPVVDFFRENKARLVYTYKDKDGSEIITILINYNDYK